MNLLDALAQLHRMERSLARDFQYHFKNLPVSEMQGTALYTVYVLSAKGDVYQKDVEHALWLRSASVTSLLDALENKGFLVRSRGKADGRTRRLTLTSEGEALANQVGERLQQFTERAFAGIPEKELSALLRSAGRIMENLT